MAIRTARAITKEVPAAASASIGSLARCNDKNPERDAHRLAQKYKLTLGIPLSTLKATTGLIHYLKMTAWASFVMMHNLWHNLAGLKEPDHDRCRAIWTLFWDRYREIDPQHEIFSRKDINLAQTCAYLFHGDEGRSLKKSPIMILSAHSALGHGIRTAKKTDDYAFNRLNFEQSTWTTRFLLAVLPRNFYRLDNGEEIDVFQDLLRVLTQDMRVLFEEGIKDRSGRTFYFAPIKIMGDWPFIIKAGCLGRSFQNAAKHTTASSQPKGICHRCRADLPGYPWEDLSQSPKWKQSINTLSPFTQTPALLGLMPNQPDAAAFFEFDMFHTWHLGIGRTFAGSAIIVLAMSALFQGSIDKRLEIVTNRFLSWCTSKGLRPVVRRFTKESLGWPKTNVFPSPHWSKGEATTVIMKWFAHEAETNRNNLPDDHLFQITCRAAMSINRFLSGVYRENVWISSQRAQVLVTLGADFLRMYGEAVRVCFEQRRALFLLMPNLHRLAHIIDDLSEQSKRATYCINPCLYSCQSDEDFVGRPSRISRRVSIMTTIERTLLRCLECSYSHYVQAGLLITDAN